MMLEKVLEYKMTKQEAKAFKISLMYIELANKYFPEYTHFKLPSGDPRKTSLFKHCYKLMSDFGSLLQDNEYRLYLTAQFQIIRNIDHGSSDAYISPNCITGDKAWKRWLFWKNKLSKVQVPQEKVNIKPCKIIKELAETKQFLAKKFTELTKENIMNGFTRILDWCCLGEMSGYYLVLSPYAKEWLEANKIDLLDRYAIDLKFYTDNLTEEVFVFFKKEFNHEINTV